jgi:para-aminobenzoate synthetase/4-amino-4-deoxychorismate lyase
MLWLPGEGFFLLEQHLTRLLDSAAFFDFAITKERLVDYLDRLSSEFFRPQRLRLLLDQDGTLHAQSTVFEMERIDHVLRASLAREPIDSTDAFLFHKTTWRTVYETARQGFESFDDVLLYNELGELTEFTIGNLVVELDGQLLTPPISCGVLAGTFRAHLLETGQIQERTLRPSDLARGTKIFRVNSLRKWQQVELKGKATA